MSAFENIGREVVMPYATWKAIEHQVETLSKDRVERNARIRTLESIVRRVAGMADDEWPDNSPGNMLALAQLVSDARAALDA